MKVIINLPKSATALASMMLSDEMEQETIDAAVKQCEETPTEIDMADFAKRSGSDNSDLQAFNMGMAIIAIAKAAEEQKTKQPKDEAAGAQDLTGLYDPIDPAGEK